MNYKNEVFQMTLFEGKKSYTPAKRVQVVNLKVVKESSFLYANRFVRSPEDGYELFKDYLKDVDREHFVVAALDTKNQPISIRRGTAR